MLRASGGADSHRRRTWEEDRMDNQGEAEDRDNIRSGVQTEILRWVGNDTSMHLGYKMMGKRERILISILVTLLSDPLNTHLPRHRD